MVAITAGEWLRTPQLGPVLLALAATVAVVLLTRWTTDSWRRRAAALVASVLSLTLLVSELWRGRLDQGDSERDAALAHRAGMHTVMALDRLRVRLERVAASAAEVDLSRPESAVNTLRRLSGSGGPSLAVVVLDATGKPRAWWGRFLTAPVLMGDSLAIIRTAFYVVLEVRRHRAGGGVVVAAAPLWRDPTVPAVVEDLTGTLGKQAGTSISFEAPSSAAPNSPRWPSVAPILAVVAHPPDRAQAVSAHVMRSSRAIAWLALALLAAATMGGDGAPQRLWPAGLGLFLVLRSPLGPALLPGNSAVFSPAAFYNDSLGPFSSSAGALAATGGVATVLAILIWYSARLPLWLARGAGFAIAVATPYLTRELARGISPPATGVSSSLWLIWHFALLLPTAALTILACGLIRLKAKPGRAVWPLIGGGWSVAAAAIGVMVFTGRPGWPVWYTALWLPAILLVTRPGPLWSSLVALGLATGSGAALMTWGNALTGRTDLALSDIAVLGLEPDPLAEPRLEGLGSALAAESGERDAAELYRAWRRSALRRERYPTRLLVWSGDQMTVDVAIDAVPISDSLLGVIATTAPPGQSVIRVLAGPGVHQVLTRRLDSTRVLEVAVAPRSQLVPAATLGRVLEGERPTLYRLAVSPVSATDSTRLSGRWRREDWALRTARRVMLPVGLNDVNIVIPLGRPIAIAVRGGLLLLADLAVLLLLWLVASWIAGTPVRLRPPLARRSYETRLALTLAAFFIVPAAVLTVVSVRQVAGEARQSRDLVLQRVLRDAVAVAGEPVRETARRLDASIGMYRDGRLESASEPVLPALGLLPPVLEPEAWHALVLDGDAFVAPHTGAPVLTGYVPVSINRGLAPAILGTVQPTSDRELLERQLDIAFSFVLAALLGVLAAVVASRRAARMLSRPVDELRQTALAFGRGWPAPVRDDEPPREFEPVFEAFGRMAADVRAGQQALEAARRRTEAVLATVSTGVVAVDGRGQILLANRTAEEMLGVALMRGSDLAELVAAAWHPLVVMLHAGGDSPVRDLELDHAGRRYAVRLAPLEGVEGWVVAVNDVTEATRAARVLAWADVANQVAHAIKNPLTPLRLGIQHLKRVRERRPEHFDTALDETAQRLLAEIDRLDAIARGFSRFAAPSLSSAPLERVEAKAVGDEVAALHHLAPGLAIRVEIPANVRVWARRDELKEVLLNLCDNARNADAHSVVMSSAPHAIRVRDDGQGIAPETLPRIFEPRFSTTSSGSGLGLAIVRRVVESWGAAITVDSQVGEGTEFTIRFPEGSTERGAAE